MTLEEEYPQYFMECEGGVYLNPAYPYVRTLIAQGAAEIVENYPVDGIHFDDYFYPAEDPALDSAAYESYTHGVEEPLALAEWRAANINAMVSQVYESIKAVKEDVVFGISPQGNIQNDQAMGADVETWAAVPGYVDYLAPQLYYSFANEALPYQQALEQWTALPQHPEFSLYVGLAGQGQHPGPAGGGGAAGRVPGRHSLLLRLFAGGTNGGRAGKCHSCVGGC